MCKPCHIDRRRLSEIIIVKSRSRKPRIDRERTLLPVYRLHEPEVHVVFGPVVYNGIKPDHPEEHKKYDSEDGKSVQLFFQIVLTLIRFFEYELFYRISGNKEYER